MKVLIAEVFEQLFRIDEVGVGIKMLPHAALRPALERLDTCSRELVYDRANARRLSWGAQLWRWCARCSARSRQREALSSLDDRLLDDIGVTRQQADAEAVKPFWK
jgi:uncharacterized protein YjiS (DUF1127 family)